MGSLALPDGRTVAYREVGNGTPVLCHPGGPGFSGAYLEDLPVGLPDRRLILIDPRGTGDSDAPASADAYSLQDYAADVEALREHLDLEAVDFLGHSHGALVGIVYAAEHPTRVRRMLLIAAGARFHDEQMEAMETAMKRRSEEPWFADASAALAAEEAGEFADDRELGGLVARELPFYFARYGERERAFVQGVLEVPIHGAALKHFNEHEFRTFDLRPVLGRIRARTSIVAGAEDFILGPAAGAELAEGIPEAEMVQLAGVGHFPWLEDPSAFSAAVASFNA
jgi:pimeloyl-ACP methyl ester carboxylesterase